MSEKSTAESTSAGPKPQRGVDPRPERTRQALFAALLELIQEKRWDRIRVQDVLDRTGIGRSTFYAHFDNKFDLLVAAAPDIILPFADSGQDFPNLLPLFEHVDEMQPVMRPLLSQPLWSEINRTFQAQLATAWRAHLTGVGVPEQQGIFAADILAGSLMAVFLTWLIDGCATSPTTMCTEFERYGRPIVTIARAA